MRMILKVALIFLLQTHMLLMDAFLQNNRLDHVSRVMCSHPTYLEHFLRTQNFILRGDGPLPYDYRHLIAIMVSLFLLFFLSLFLLTKLRSSLFFIISASA